MVHLVVFWSVSMSVCTRVCVCIQMGRGWRGMLVTFYLISFKNSVPILVQQVLWSSLPPTPYCEPFLSPVGCLTILFSSLAMPSLSLFSDCWKGL